MVSILPIPLLPPFIKYLPSPCCYSFIPSFYSTLFSSTHSSLSHQWTSHLFILYFGLILTVFLFPNRTLFFYPSIHSLLPHIHAILCPSLNQILSSTQQSNVILVNYLHLFFQVFYKPSIHPRIYSLPFLIYPFLTLFFLSLCSVHRCLSVTQCSSTLPSLLFFPSSLLSSAIRLD